MVYDEISSLVLPQEEVANVPLNCNPHHLRVQYDGIPEWFGMLPAPYDGRFIPENSTISERRYVARLQPLLADVVEGSVCPYLFSYTLHDTVFAEERIKQVVATKKLVADKILGPSELPKRLQRRRRVWRPLVEYPHLAEFVNEVVDTMRNSGYLPYHNKIEYKILPMVQGWNEVDFFRFYVGVVPAMGRLPYPYDLCSYRTRSSDTQTLTRMTEASKASSVSLFSALPYFHTFSENNLGLRHRKDRVHTLLIIKMMTEYATIPLDYMNYLSGLAYDVRELVGLAEDLGIDIFHEFIELADEFVDAMFVGRDGLCYRAPDNEQFTIVRLNETSVLDRSN